MSCVTVVGSGASAVHFSLSLLEKGYEVVMLDVGTEAAPPVRPEDALPDLKRNLEDPIQYFLGDDFGAVVYPGREGEYYGFPPSKDHVFATPEQFPIDPHGFSPLASHARGGLAETWTGGVYPLNDNELSDFPVSYQELSPYYDLVAERIGVSGAVDDLARFMPVHDHMLEPLRLDEHSARILEAYTAKRQTLNTKYRCYVGRSRVATLSTNYRGRQGCGYLGRCLWGCPRGSLYTPSATLAECQTFSTFRYIPSVHVDYFETDRRRRITAVTTTDVKTGAAQRVAVDQLALAAGTLSSSRIYLESIRRESGQVLTLGGLMDNRQVLVPFVNLGMLGKAFEPETYQYHQLGLGLEQDNGAEYVHGQVTTLKSAPLHPIAQRLPLGLKSSLFLYRNVHAALGLVNLNFFDRRRSENVVTLEPATSDHPSRLVIRYTPPPDEPDRLRQSARTLRCALWQLNCVMIPGLAHTRPMGASVHYAGLLPMSNDAAAHTTTPMCQSRDFKNLFIVDGTTFPFLPAKNLTFTLMANAARVAAEAF